MERYRADGVRTSLLSVAGTVAIGSVGLTAVGEVMGTIVQQTGWSGYGGCGYYGGGFGRLTTVSSGSARPNAGYRPYVDALNRGYRTALDRLAQEAVAMQAHGVVDIRLRTVHVGQQMREVVAMGTAVHAPGVPVGRKLFRTDLSGPDVAKAVHAGWMPVDLAIGISVAIRHDDYGTRRQASSWSSGNTEVEGYTELVEHVRSEARQRFTVAARDTGGEAAIVRAMDLQVYERECGVQETTDHVAESHVFGSTLVQFHPGRVAPTSALSILPLRRG
jgi:uncharacterized protein YbjQ (UPF0145 family)